LGPRGGIVPGPSSKESNHEVSARNQIKGKSSPCRRADHRPVRIDIGNGVIVTSSITN